MSTLYMIECFNQQELTHESHKTFNETLINTLDRNRKISLDMYSSGNEVANK